MNNNIKIYQQEINTIFSCLEKLSTNWNNQDNINFINNLSEYKEDAITFSNLISEQENSNKEGEVSNDR